MTQGRCPSCGAAVELSAGTAQVVVCSHCQTVVAKKGLNLEAIGKVAAILPTDSPLQLGVSGRYQRKPFQLVGHLQKDHGKGPWDEWYLELDDGSSAWLAEAEGGMYLLRSMGFERSLQLSDLEPGFRWTLPLELGGGTFTVEEKGHGRTVAAEGQLPSEVRGIESHGYVDATGTQGEFLTLDFGSGDTEAEVFVGEKVELSDLAISPDQLRVRPKKAVELQQARCTQCNGPLELRAPDRTRRVACPFCGALLDVSKGKLSFLQALEKPAHDPVIPLGRKGRIDNTEWICIGFLVRSTTVEGVVYPWEEYLLYHPRRGFRWLMSSNGHWTYLEPIAAGEVEILQGYSATYKGKTYKAFQAVDAVTNFVLGEFYWEVTAGETARAVEYVSPPESVNEDRTYTEVSYTLGTYLTREEVQKAFKLDALEEPHGIAPNQPNPLNQRAASQLGMAALFALAVVGLFVAMTVFSSRELLLDKQFAAGSAASGSPEAIKFSEPFDVQGRSKLLARLQVPNLNNAWLGVQGDLINEASGDVHSFYLESSYYSGRDYDGAWTEGSQADSEILSALPKGRYVLRVTPVFDALMPAPRLYQLRLEQTGPRFLWLFWALLGLFVPPLITWLRSSSFESQRWNESNLISHGSDDDE